LLTVRCECFVKATSLYSGRADVKQYVVCAPVERSKYLGLNRFCLVDNDQEWRQSRCMMTFGACCLISGECEDKAASRRPDHPLHEFPIGKTASMLIESRHELSIDLFSIRSGDDNATARVRVEPSESAKCYDPLGFAAAVWSNQRDLDAFVLRAVINSDISFELPVVKLEVQADLGEGKNVVKNFGFNGRQRLLSTCRRNEASSQAQTRNRLGRRYKASSQAQRASLSASEPIPADTNPSHKL
jgi:hypothetical protein